MKKEPSFHHVQIGMVGMQALARGEFELSLGKWVCPRCHLVRPGCGAIDVRIEDDGPIEKPLGIEAKSGLGLVWTQFLDPLGPELVASELYLGSVMRGNGDVVKGWSTFHGRHRVIVRGSKKSLNYRRCQACGRKSYMADGPYYLCPTPAPEHQILTTDCGFVLRPELFALLKIEGRRRSLRVQHLDVLETPADGLPTELVDPS
jgi:hypothetical protein